MTNEEKAAIIQMKKAGRPLSAIAEETGIRQHLDTGTDICPILSLVLGIVSLVLAVVVFVHPTLLANLMMQTTGVAMIFEGISFLIVLAQKE